MTISTAAHRDLTRTVVVPMLLAGGLVALPQHPTRAAQIVAAAEYCPVETQGTTVEVVRPQPDDDPPVIDDVNWFARTVPNPSGHWVVGFASHDQNYLYDLTTGTRIRIPDASDAVATPDGRYMTVPSHYTAGGTVNFYELDGLLDRLARGEDAADVAPVFAHRHPDVADVYYQSVGVLPRRDTDPGDVTVYRMMFSGGNHPQPPGFRIVDYTLRRDGGTLVATASLPMRLCPQIVRDMATPFISKDGRYVAAHDDGYPEQPASLKIFEITAVDPEGRTTTCEPRVDFGFAAGKADFSFDGSMLTFHISKHAYLTPFVNGGIAAPTMTDIVIVDLERNAAGAIVGYGGMARVTTSRREGVGNYFPAFMPDGRLFYISNAVPKNDPGEKRFELTVVDPRPEVRVANVFADPGLRAGATAIGELWRAACASELQPFKPGEAAWSLLSLEPGQCRDLVRAEGPASSLAQDRDALLAVCDALGGPRAR